MDTMEEQRTIFKIPEGNLKKFEAACERLSRRAEKLGLDGLRPVIFGYSFEKLDGFPTKVFEVLFTYEPIKLAGWTFAATIDHSQEAGNIVRTASNLKAEVPAMYRDREPVCDHCNVRRMRRDTYVLHHEETNTWKQVGKSCLRDFLGVDPSNEAKRAEFLSYAIEAATGYQDYHGSDHRYIEVADYCVHVAAAIRVYGWVSRAKAADIFEREDRFVETSGSTAMSNYYRYHNLCRPDYDFRPIPILEEDRVLAEAALVWARDLANRDSLSDYEHNIAIIAQSEMMELRASGLAASIVGVFYARQQTEARRRAETLDLSGSQFVGKEGDRLRKVDATVLSYFRRETQDYVSYIYRFLLNGNVLTWFASRPVEGAVAGCSIKLSGTIKRHSEYKGVKTTVLTRCTLADISKPKEVEPVDDDA